MITYQIESFTEQLEELKPILPIHYEELALDKDKVPLSPQYDTYQQKELLGELIFVTARERGELVGYFIGFVAPGLHYSTCLTCTLDIFYIRPDKRGSNAGFEMLKFVEKQLLKRGVDRWFMGSKVHLDASWLFERLGFEKVEVYYSKYLGA